MAGQDDPTQPRRKRVRAFNRPARRSRWEKREADARAMLDQVQADVQDDLVKMHDQLRPGFRAD